MGKSNICTFTNPKSVKTSLVITSVNQPTEAVKMFAKGSLANDIECIVVGDTKSPSDFSCEGVTFLSIEDQLKLPFKYILSCPTKHYCRKNIGYLYSMAKGCQRIVESDDDNFPYQDFWDLPLFNGSYPCLKNQGHANVYKYFTDQFIWPRGFPLEKLDASHPKPLNTTPNQKVYTPIIQGLANDNPDVDAIYRLTRNLPIQFTENKSIALSSGSYCAFNSQNTIWNPEAYPLLYLPAYCSFRMTDIWRSFVAQRIAHAFGWSILFTSPTVWQERNEHSLINDFEQEIPGYSSNLRIINKLHELELSPRVEDADKNLIKCYELLVDIGVVDVAELDLLACWIEDIAGLQTILGSDLNSSESHTS